jgi:hypothetical protein
MLMGLPARAQQVLYFDDFESPPTAFLLNTTDLGGQMDGANHWTWNDVYAGGSGTTSCLGLNFTFDIPTTAAQPAGITNANGHYVHMTSMVAQTNGIENCNFATADGLCTPTETYFARMNTDVSTVGATEVSLAFWWLCGGGNQNYGQVYYSTDGGTTWTQLTSPILKYKNQPTWTQQTISDPAFAGQATLRFGFRFVNGSSLNASDPGFAIDDLSITATTAEATLGTGTLAYSAYCPGSNVLVPYEATGPWNAGNVFTAELSDASGSFANPVAIGSLASTVSDTIAAVIPAGTALGSGYLVRVVGSDPAMVADNTSAVISIDEAPWAGMDTHVTFCTSDAPQTLLNFMPGASDCGAWTGPDGSPFPDVLDPATAAAGPYTYTTDCASGCPQDESVLTVGIAQAVQAGTDSAITVCVYDPAFPLFSLLGGDPDAGGTWLDPALEPSNSMYDPATMTPGCYTYAVAALSPCVSDSAVVCITEDACAGIHEAGEGLAGMRWLGQRGSDQLFTTGDVRPEQVRLLDAQGRQVDASWRLTGTNLVLHMEGLSSGVYVLHVHAGGLGTAVRLVNR